MYTLSSFFDLSQLLREDSVLDKYKNGDVDDIAYRTALIDTFVIKIYHYDDDEVEMEIHCTAIDKNNHATDESGSSMAQLAPQLTPKANRIYVSGKGFLVVQADSK